MAPWVRPSAVAVMLALSCIPPVAFGARCEELSGSRIRWIVPNNPGGGYDAYARLLQPFLETDLSATVVVENRSGAGGVVGASLIRDARPDGRTLGIINASGLLAAGLDREVPDPARDFAVLGRLLSNHTVLVTGRSSGIRSLDELLVESQRRPIVIGVRDAGSASLFIVPVVASLLGFDYELVTGYDGNAARSLAAIRGEVDVLLQNFDSVHRFIADEELIPLMQVVGTDPDATPGPNAALLAGVPVLGGEAGVAQARARLTGRTREQAILEARLLAALIDAGRLVVAPRALPEDLRACLEAALAGVMSDDGFRSAAGRAGLTLEPASAAVARADLEVASAAVLEFASLVKAAMQRARH